MTLELLRVPSSAEEVIEILQSYKGAAQVLFRSKVNLSFDRQTKEIQFEIPPAGEYYLKKVSCHQLGYRVPKLESLIEPAALIKLVDTWIEKVLSPEEAEVLFWRFINHDFEREMYDRMKKYVTLSYMEIARRMQKDDRTVWRICKRALAKILRHVNEKVSNLGG